MNNGELMASPAFWNGAAYFTPGGSPVQSYQIGSDGKFSLLAKTTQRYTGAHSPSISSDGNTNGIVWLISGNNLTALDAVSLKLLYSSSQNKTRDFLPKVAHFATQTVANGRVYVATQNSLEAYGLLHILSIESGNNQSGPILSPLPAPIVIETENPYTGQPIQGVTVNFSDGGKGGFFTPPSQVSGADGVVSTTYTFGKKVGVYSLTISATNFGDITATETATAAAASRLIPHSGQKQTGIAGSTLPNPIVASAVDIYNNPVAGVTINFSANKGGVPSPSSAQTDSKGLARTYLQLPTTTGTITVTASAAGLKSVSFPEYSVAGPPASVAVSGGNNQSAPAGTTLPQALTVIVADPYGNPVSGAAVTFDDGGAQGVFLNPNPGNTGSNGAASQMYTLPQTPGTVNITANVVGVTNSAVFTEVAQ